MDEQEISTRLSELDRRVTEEIGSLTESISDLRKKPKDGWEKFQILAALLVPASIVLVGYYITTYQASLEATSDEVIASDDRAQHAWIAQGNLVHVLIDDLTAEEPTRRAVAVEALGIFAPKHAKALIALAVPKDAPDEVVAAARAVTEKLATFSVTVDNIEIVADCNQFFGGDFFYSFYLNDRVIRDLPRSKTVTANDGEVIPVNAEGRVSLLLTPTAALTIRGSISDKDRFLAGDDDHLGTVKQVVPLADGSWSQFTQLKFYRDKDCYAIAHYTIKRIDH